MTEAQRRKALLDAVAVLEADAAQLEQLIEQLKAKIGAGDAASPPTRTATPTPRPVTMPAGEGRLASPVTSEQARYVRQGDRATAWVDALAAIASATADAAAAVRDKNPDRLREAVASRLDSQRTAGLLLLEWRGRVSLPGTATVHQRRLCSAAARFSAAEFAEEKIRQQNAALAAGIGKGQGNDKAALSGGAKSEPPDKNTPTLAEIGVSKRQPSQAPPLVTTKVDSEDRTHTTKPGANPKKAAVPAEGDRAAADELSKIVAVIADAQVEGAMHDAEKLKAAIATRARAERRAGELLIALAGRLRPLAGISKPQSRKYRRDAEVPADEFEAKVRRAQTKAVAAIGVAPGKPAPAKRTPPRSPPKPAMKISDWRDEPDGSRSRTVSAVDAGGAEAP